MQITVKRFCRWHFGGGSRGLCAKRGPCCVVAQHGGAGGMIDLVECYRARCGGAPVGSISLYWGALVVATVYSARGPQQ
jgi:hypothetical protein